MGKTDILQSFLDKRIPKQGSYKGRVGGQCGHVYYDGDTLYSYGSHFPLLIRHKWGYLLNADKYSSTTSSHQSMCRSVATIQIPLSALRQAGIPYDNFNLIDKGEERVDILGYYTQHRDKTLTPAEYGQLNRREQRNCGNNGGSEWDGSTYKGYRELTEFWTYRRDITVAQYQALLESEREIWIAKEERRPEHDVIEYQGRYFLSGMDGQNYFLCQLPEPVKTVAEALEILIPPDLRGYHSVTIQRQGEWFFEPFKLNDAMPFYKTMERNFTLPLDRNNSNLHIATRGIVKGGFIYVSGSVRHSEHRTLHLSKADNPIIYRAYHNRAVESYSVNGRVD